MSKTFCVKRFLNDIEVELLRQRGLSNNISNYNKFKQEIKDGLWYAEYKTINDNGKTGAVVLLIPKTEEAINILRNNRINNNVCK